MNFLKAISQQLLLLCVGIPTLVVGLFTIFLTSDELAATATAIVKENKGSTGPAMPGVAAGLFDYGNRTSLEDAYLLQAYLQSEDFIMSMNADLDLAEHFSSSGFPYFQSLSSNADDGAIFDYLIKRLEIDLSVDSSIIGLQFRSFDPETSQKVLQYIIEKAESKINDLSQRMTESHMLLSSRELQRAEEELKSAKKAVLAFQTANGWLSEKEITLEFAQIETIRGLLLEAEVERVTLLASMNPNSPRIQAIESNIEAMKETLKERLRKMTNEGSDSTISLAYEYGNLNLDREFAQTKYEAATAAFQQAQLEASKQHKFLLLISPVKAESSPVAPTPIESTLTTFVVALLAFLVGRLVILTIKDHTV